MYEVTTIGGVHVPSTKARPIGALPTFDTTKLKSPEVIGAAAAALVVGLILGALLAHRK